MGEQFFVQLIGIRSYLLEEQIKQLGCLTEIISSPSDLSYDADICLASGVYFIIEPNYLSIPRLGIWGFHESPLPKGRGCAPIHWTILGGEKELTVSFFKLVEKVDCGSLLGQESCFISRAALLEDLRVMATDLTKKLLDKYLIKFLSGKVKPYDQAGEATLCPKRTPEDSKLDISKSLDQLWDLIRICDNEKYPAWFEINGEKIILKRYRFG